ncbi:MAG: hypothetical protein ACKV22_30640 [Bryobacteraceae bacterium]
MTDRELDALFAGLRGESPEIASVRDEVMARAASPPRKHWPIAITAAIAASAAAWFLLVPPEPERLVLSKPVTLIERPALVRVPVVRARAKPPRPPKREPETLFIERDGQTEVHMATADPDIKIIWLAQGDSN